MKTCILISGHLRSFDKCLPTLQWNIFRKFGDLSFFVSTVEDEDAPKIKYLQDKYPAAQIEYSSVAAQPDFSSELKPWTPGAPYSHEPYAISVPPQAVLGQLWQLEEVYKLYHSKTTYGYAPDVFIRCRPDLWFHEFEYNGGYNQLNTCHVPGWGGFGGCNDRFAVMGADVAKTYFTTFSRREMLFNEGCPLHPESLIKASLDMAGVKIVKQNWFFSCYRKDGTMRQPEIAPADVLRGRHE